MSIEITVSNQTELQAALAQATGGETILLQDGQYGSIDISKDFDSTVKIQAINSLGATFSDIDIPGGSNIHLDGLTISGQPRVDQNAHHITITNSTIEGGIYFRDADHIVVASNDISGGGNTFILNSITNFTITENYIHDASLDLVRITGVSQYGLFENNTLHDIAAASGVHADFVQMFGTSAGTPSDIVFRGNYLYDDPSTGDVKAQGFFFGDPTNGGYKNILVEENLINVGATNSIAIHGGQENVVIQNNTLIPWPDGSGAIIRLTDARGWTNEGTTVVNNVAKSVMNQTDTPGVQGNYFYGSADLAKLFSGDGSNWQDFVPVENSAIDLDTGLGAANRLQELLNGTSYDTGNDAPLPPADTGTEPAGGTGTDTGTTTPNPDADNDQSQLEPTLEGAAFSMLGTQEINGSADVIEVAHSSDLALSSGTISFGFNADTVAGVMGLISKDASYYTGGGNHLVSYIENGTLIVRFQDGSGDEIAQIGGIQENTDYDLQISFGGNQVAVWLNGEQVHTADFAMTWESNAEYLQVGARGWSSQTGQSGFGDVFNGTISDVVIVEGQWTPEQMQELIYGSDPLPSNDNPDAVDDMLTTDAGSDLLVDAASDLLANDNDPDGDAISLTDLTQPGNGTLTDNGDGTYTYAPNAGFTGVDSFTYTITDGENSNTAAVNITVNAVPTLPDDIDANTVFEQTETVNFDGRNSSIFNLEHDAALELQEGTIAFTFNADDLKGRQGLFSKDARYYSGDGNHVSVMLVRDDLVVRYQDADSDAYFTFENIDANRDYDVQTWFGDGEIGLAVDGQLVETRDFDFDLSVNKQYMQIGGLGWSSPDGDDHVNHAFDGTMSEVMVLDQALPIDVVDLIA